MPHFSVIIPTRNRPELTRRAVESVVAQDGHGCEIIVVDDGSTDETPEVLMSLRKRHGIRTVLGSGEGAAAARNTGAKQARGQFLVFLDSDDELCRNACQRFAAALEDQSVGTVCSAAEFVDGGGKGVRNQLCEAPYGPFRQLVPDPFSTANVVSVSKPRSLGPAYENGRGLFLAGTFAVRRDVFLELGGFASQCRSSQHTEFSLRLIPYLKDHGLQLAAIDEPTVCIHTHVRNHLRGDLENLLAGARYIIDNHEGQLKKSPKHYSDWCSIAAVYAAKLRQFALARSLLRRAVAAGPRKGANVARLIVACLPPLATRVWRPETIK